ncbi:MAG: GDSL-type esterase/lipase family protein, partial [Myxococcota bacterium]|nr:GDSL-type esterase/lipase family protein [Myxococcota bacterium]
MTPTRRLGFSLVAVVGVTLGLELAARGLQWVAPSLSVVAPNQAGLGPGVSLEPDPELLFRSRTGQSRSESVQVEINDLGMRGDAVPPPGPAARVVYLGDSSVFGWGVPRDEAFPWATGRRLARDRRQVVTLNAGTPGYSSAQSRFQLEKLGPKLAPDVVVIASLWSDMMRTGWRDRELFERFGSAEHAAELRQHEALSRSALFVLLRARLLSLRSVPDNQYVLWDTVIGGKDGTGATRASVADHRANLEAMADTAEALGARPLFLILPANRLGEHPPDDVLRPYQDNHREVAAARGVPCVDMDTRWR